VGRGKEWLIVEINLACDRIISRGHTNPQINQFHAILVAQRETDAADIYFSHCGSRMSSIERDNDYTVLLCISGRSRLANHA